MWQQFPRRNVAKEILYPPNRDFPVHRAVRSELAEKGNRIVCEPKLVILRLTCKRLTSRKVSEVIYLMAKSGLLVESLNRKPWGQFSPSTKELPRVLLGYFQERIDVYVAVHPLAMLIFFFFFPISLERTDFFLSGDLKKRRNPSRKPAAEARRRAYLAARKEKEQGESWKLPAEQEKEKLPGNSVEAGNDDDFCYWTPNLDIFCWKTL